MILARLFYPLSAIHHKFAIKNKFRVPFFAKTPAKQRKLRVEQNRTSGSHSGRLGGDVVVLEAVSMTNPKGCVVHPTVRDALFFFSAGAALVSVVGASVRSKGTCGCMVAP